MKTLLRIAAITAVTALMLCLAVCAIADTPIFYTMKLDCANDSYEVGETVYVKASIENIKFTDGYVGIGISIRYDPVCLEALPADGGGVAEANIPNTWKENGEILENVVKNEDGTPAGEIRLNYVAPLNGEDVMTNAVKDSDFYAVVKFKAISAGETYVRILSDDGYNVCSGYSEDGTVTRYPGKGSELKITLTSGDGGIQSEASAVPEEQRSYTLYYIIMGAAVAIAAAALIVSKLRKK